jgi:hypothetical protein
MKPLLEGEASAPIMKLRHKPIMKRLLKLDAVPGIEALVIQYLNERTDGTDFHPLW